MVPLSSVYPASSFLGSISIYFSEDLSWASHCDSISFGNEASSHSGLIPLKTAYKKRGELLWAIASKKNFINLHSAAFDTVFGSNLVHA